MSEMSTKKRGNNSSIEKGEENQQTRKSIKTKRRNGRKQGTRTDRKGSG